MTPAELNAQRKSMGLPLKAVHAPGAMNESKHQAALMTWARLATNTRPELRWLHSTLNGAPLGYRTAARLKSEGLIAGLPDLMLDIPRGPYCGLKLELKTPRIPGGNGSKTRQAGKLSDEQNAWLEHYNEVGYLGVVAYGWEQARQIIEDYLDDK